MWSKFSPRAGRIVLFALLLAACRSHPSEPQFPKADRPVAPIVGGTFSTEDARDRAGEAEEVMQLAGVKPGMSVADVGAGEGYYTVRLARVVGPKGRVLAEDIVPEVRDALSDRVQRERLDGKAQRAITGARREEYVVALVVAEVEDALPGRAALPVHPCGHRDRRLARDGGR